MKKLIAWIRKRPMADPREAPDVCGIADVDPVPLAQTAGEGIDADAVARAHEDVIDQREKLPRRGDNVL
jgi:hypothetical protein